MRLRRWYTCRDIAAALDVPLYTVRRDMRLGRIERLPLGPEHGRAARISPEAFETYAFQRLAKAAKRWAKANEPKPAPKPARER